MLSGLYPLSYPADKRGAHPPGLDRAFGSDFNRFDRDTELTVLPPDLAVLMVGATARQAASPTAAVQAGFARVSPDPMLFAPLDGAFNGPWPGRWRVEQE